MTNAVSCSFKSEFTGPANAPNFQQAKYATIQSLIPTLPWSFMDTYRNFIGGKWIESTSAKTVNNINPANTDDLIGSVRQATREEARAAVEAAAEAFHGWRLTPAPARGK